MFLKDINTKNKIALITGAGKGIGKACAIALAEAGAHVIIISRTEKDLIEVQKIIRKLKRKCTYFVCDVTNIDEIKKILNYLYQQQQLLIMLRPFLKVYQIKL